MSLRVFSSALQHASKNYKENQAIQMKKQEMQQDKELFDLKKKKLDMDLKESKLKGDITEFEFEQKKNYYNQMFKPFEQQIKAKNSMIGMAETKNKNEGQALKQFTQVLANRDPEVKNFINNSRWSAVRDSVGAVIGYNPDPNGVSGANATQPYAQLTPKGVEIENPDSNMIARRIQQKISEGMPLDMQEQKIAKTSLGYVEDPKSFDDLDEDKRLQVRSLAEKMAKGGKEQSFLGSTAPTNEEIEKFMPQAAEFLYPSLAKKTSANQPQAQENSFKAPSSVFKKGLAKSVNPYKPPKEAQIIKDNRIGEAYRMRHPQYGTIKIMPKSKAIEAAKLGFTYVN